MLRATIRLCLTMACLLACTTTGRAAEPGFAFLQVSYGPGSLNGAIWYPSHTAPAPLTIGPYTMAVAQDAPVTGTDLKLIVISHGNGGSMLGHDDTAIALARAGFVVAAVEHAGDNYRDHANELELWRRPPQISALIDAALTRWPGHAAIDPARIGMFGFSSGGFTALVAIGGTPDFSRIAPYCRTHTETFVCTIQKSHAAPQPGSLDNVKWHHDPRIRAAAIAAPTLGVTFSRAGLAGVTVPVQLWAAADDHVLPVADNALAVRNALPSPPEYHLVPGADHFDFLPPCGMALAAVVPPICGSRPGFDRAAFHTQMNAALVQFFNRTLARK